MPHLLIAAALVLILAALLTSCAGGPLQPWDGHRIIRVDLNQDAPPLHPYRVIPTTPEVIRRVCRGTLACTLEWADGSGTVFYPAGNQCLYLHEMEHVRYGPAHSTEAETCRQLLTRHGL